MWHFFPSNMKNYFNMSVEEVVFICCCFKHPESHKYRALRVCRVHVQMRKQSSHIGKGVYRVRSGRGLVCWEPFPIFGNAWRTLGFLLGLCDREKKPSKEGEMKGRAVLGGDGCLGTHGGWFSPSKLVLRAKTRSMRAWCRHFPTYLKQLQAQT